MSSLFHFFGYRNVYTKKISMNYFESLIVLLYKTNVIFLGYLEQDREDNFNPVFIFIN
jgi:hypothetical protein